MSVLKALLSMQLKMTLIDEEFHVSDVTLAGAGEPNQIVLSIA